MCIYKADIGQLRRVGDSQKSTIRAQAVRIEELEEMLEAPICIYSYLSLSLYMYIYIYIYRERERDLHIMCVCVYIYIYIYIHVSQPSRSRVSPRPGRGGSPEEGEPEEGQLECQEGGRGAKVFISRWSFQHRLDCSARDVLGAKLGEPATRSPRSDFRATCCPDPPLDGLGFRV